jgi:hypothetical protein
VIIVGYKQLPSRHRLIALQWFAVVAIAAFVLGEISNQFLTCDEFT